MRLSFGLDSWGTKKYCRFLGADGPAPGVIRGEQEERVLAIIVPRTRVETGKGQRSIPHQVFPRVHTNETARVGHLNASMDRGF